MKVIATLAASAAALILSAGAASAQVSPQNEADLQCLIVFAVVGDMAADDPQTANGAAMGITYYLGRLNGRDPQTDWLEYISRNTQYFEAASVTAHLQRCTTEFTERGRYLQTWGQRFIEMGS